MSNFHLYYKFTYSRARDESKIDWHNEGPLPLLVEAVEAAAHHQVAVQDLQAVQAEAVVVLKESSMFGRIRLCEY